MIDQEGFRAYLHVPDFLDPTRRSQTIQFWIRLGCLYCGDLRFGLCPSMRPSWGLQLVEVRGVVAVVAWLQFFCLGLE